MPVAYEFHPEIEADGESVAAFVLVDPLLPRLVSLGSLLASASHRLFREFKPGVDG
jgi:hypothetical protein